MDNVGPNEQHFGAAFGQQLTLRDLGSTPTPETRATQILKGTIVDIKTGQPATADVNVHGECVREGVSQFDLKVNLTTERLTEIVSKPLVTTPEKSLHAGVAIG